MLHFENTATSYYKGGHAILKRNLELFTNNLKIVINKIKIMLMSQH